MRRVFEAGGVRRWDSIFFKDRLPNRVERAQLHKDITQLLRPDEKAQYAVIVGAVGAGKSTAVRKAILELEEPKGAVYFLPPTLLIGFSSALANALGYYRPAGWADRAVRFFTGGTKGEAAAPRGTAEPQATWSVLEPCLIKAAARYCAMHGAPPVLVLDAMDLVAKADPSFFLTMQDFAKKCADMGILRVVLVCSDDGRALPLLQASSAITRADVIYEVGDISDEDATAWLETDYKMERSRAEALVDTVAGGRFPLLLMCGASPKSVDAISEEVAGKTELDLWTAGVSPTAPLFRAMLPVNRIEMPAAQHLLPESKLQALLSSNILSAHADRTYTFHDRHVERFVQRANGFVRGGKKGGKAATAGAVR
jgi:hypothetical protein